MSSERPYERPDEFSKQPVASTTSGDGSRPVATVVVHGELVRDPVQKSPRQDQQAEGQQAEGQQPEGHQPQDQATAKDSQEQENKAQENKAQENKGKDNAKDKTPRKVLSEAKVALQRRLPALDDDADIGIQKEQRVTRDGKADLSFTGTLLASAAPPSAPQGQWKEYRIYETTGGKYVFSKLGRNVEAGKQDTHEADVFDPAPQSVPSKLLKSARELTHAGPTTWTEAAVGFFGYDPLAKALYRKLSGQFEEHIS
jgi:hypothetical protein